MTVEEIKNKFNEAAVIVAGEQCNSQLSVCIHIYIRMFNEYPHLINILSEGSYLNEKLPAERFGSYNTPLSELDDEDDEDLDDVYTFENVNIPKTVCALNEKFKDTCYIHRCWQLPIIVGEKFIIVYDTYDDTLCVLQDSPELREDIKSCVVDNKKDKDIREISYVTHDSMGFGKTRITVGKQDVDVKKQYNDDLPDEEIVKFLKSGNSGLLLLHGDAGTGKCLDYNEEIEIYIPEEFYNLFIKYKEQI